MNLWGGVKGKPLSYDTVSKIVKRLNKKTNIQFNLHMFRHTHATQLVKSGWDMSYVKKRLGHKQIQTTVNVYTHLSDEDMKKEIQKFHRLKNGD